MNYNLTIACSKEKLKDIRLFVRESLKNHGLDDVEISALVLAIDEISANLIIHGHNNNPKDHFDLIIDIKKGQGVVFRILDDSDMFDINNYEAPDIDDLIKRQRKGGIGLILVKKIMDDIEFDKFKGKNCCKLVKRANVV